jgi:hypothetical protein
VPASTTGSVCTTVEGKLTTVWPIGPAEAIELQRQVGPSTSIPIRAIRSSFHSASLRWAK